MWKAVFKNSVSNADNVPEMFFSTKSNVKSRNITMLWIVGEGLLCNQGDQYFLVPRGNIDYVHFA